MIISTMRAAPSHGFVPGKCAKCSGAVYESLFTLDDAYNVWMGRCPHCSALNYLAMSGLRGYTNDGMTLVLPTDEEVTANGLPPDTPTSGACGRPADWHGTVLGELAERLVSPTRAKELREGKWDEIP